MLACIAFSCPNLEYLEVSMSDCAVNRITGFVSYLFLILNPNSNFGSDDDDSVLAYCLGLDLYFLRLYLAYWLMIYYLIAGMSWDVLLVIDDV